MVFTAEFEFTLRATAFAIVMAAWMLVRPLLGLRVSHPWFAATLAGLASSIAACVAVVPGTGPVPPILALGGALVVPSLFAAGVRFEATGSDVSRRGLAVLAAVALAIGAALYFAIGDPSVRISVLRLLVALCVGSSLLWIPRLVRTKTKAGSALLVIFALGLLGERATMFAQRHASVPGAFPLIPYLQASDTVWILTGGVAILCYSAQGARREKAQRRSG